MVRRDTSPKRNVADPGSIPGASKGEVAELADANQVNENLSGSWDVAPTVSEDAGKTTQPGDKRSGCWTRCKTRRRYTPIVTKPEISTGHHTTSIRYHRLSSRYPGRNTLRLMTLIAETKWSRSLPMFRFSRESEKGTHG